MSDKKLDKLIEEYGNVRYEYGRWGGTKLECHKRDEDKARQAIVDYVEKEKKEEKLLRNRYNNLIMAVASKYPDESRHDTALRYIKERESGEITGRKHNE